MTLGKLIKYFSFILLFFITISNSAGKYLDNSSNNTILDTNSNVYGKIIAKDMRNLFDYKTLKPTLLEYVEFLYKSDSEIDVIEHTHLKVKIKRNYIYNEVYNKHLISCIYLIEADGEYIESCSYNRELLEKISLELNNNISLKNQETLKEIIDQEFILKLNKELLNSIYDNYLSAEIAEAYLKTHLGVKEFSNELPRIEQALSILKYNPEIDFIGKYEISSIKEYKRFIKEKTMRYDYNEYRCETVIENQIFMLMNNFQVDIDKKYNMQLIEWTKFPKLEYKTSCSN